MFDENNNVVKIGIIGGGLGIRCLLPKFNEISGVKVVAFLSSNYQRTLEISQKYEIKHPCRDIEYMGNLKLDLVCVASPSKEHYWQAEFLIGKNIHVLCEKPLCLVQSEIDMLLNKAKMSSSTLFIDLELRFNPYFKKIKELLKSMGKVYYVNLFFQSSLYLTQDIKNTWNYSEKEGGGIRLAILPHFLDLLYFWFDKECTSLRGRLYNVHEREGVSEFCNVSLFLEDNITVNLTATAIIEGDKELDITIIGEHGKIEFDLQHKLKIYGKDVPVNLPEYYVDAESIFRSSFACYAHILIDAIRQGKMIDNFTTEKQIRDIHRLLEDIKFSSNHGEEVIYKLETNKFS